MPHRPSSVGMMSGALIGASMRRPVVPEPGG